MLKNKAQIARESIKNPESFQGPRPWTPVVRDFGLCARDVRAPTKSFAPPPPPPPPQRRKSWIRPCSRLAFYIVWKQNESQITQRVSNQSSEYMTGDKRFKLTDFCIAVVTTIPTCDPAHVMIKITSLVSVTDRLILVPDWFLPYY